MNALRFSGTLMITLASAVFLCACSQDSNQALPSDATVVASGDKVISYTAPHDGKMYLRDDTSNTIVYSTDVHAGQSVKFDPDLKQVIVNGAVAAVPNSGHDHSWYYQRSSMEDRYPNPEPITPRPMPQ